MAKAALLSTGWRVACTWCGREWEEIVHGKTVGEAASYVVGLSCRCGHRRRLHADLAWKDHG